MTEVDFLCPEDHCYVSTLGHCRDGFTPPVRCPRLTEHETPPSVSVSAHGLPWSGLALGTDDLELVSAGGRPRLIALVGLAGAGKTTALATMWMRLRRGARLAGLTLAGSYTLSGWHGISRHLSFPPEGSRVFPPHTTATGNREPAMLHVALRGAKSLTDVFITDVPGEWFRQWAEDRDAVPAATWMAERADLFVLMSDSQALSGSGRGRARADYLTLADRVADECRNRPVLPVRAKADVALTDEMNKQLESAERHHFSRAAVPMSVYPADGSEHAPVEAQDSMVEIATRPITAPTIPGERITGDPLRDFRRVDKVAPKAAS